MAQNDKQPTLKIASVAFLGVVLLAGCGAPPLQTSDLTETHFRETATVKDDDLENVATISTVYGWQSQPGIIAGRLSDTYLRAFIDKKSGHTEFQVYTWLRYPGDWRDYQQVNYQTVNGLRTAALTTIGHTGVDCSLHAVGCIYMDQLGFDISERDLRQLHSAYGSMPSHPWRFKLKAVNGADFDAEITIAEIGGLLSKVDEYRNAKHLAQRGGQ